MVPANAIRIEWYPYLLFSLIFSKASALFSRRAKQSLFCLVIVSIGKTVQNGSILLKRTTFLSIHNLTSVFLKIKKNCQRMFVVARRGKREKFPCKASFAAKFSTHFPFTHPLTRKTLREKTATAGGRKQ